MDDGDRRFFSQPSDENRYQLCVVLAAVFVATRSQQQRFFACLESGLFSFKTRYGEPLVLRSRQDEDNRSDTLTGKTDEGVYVGISGSSGREASSGDVDGCDLPPAVAA
jgi:hypothetical protein